MYTPPGIQRCSRTLVHPDHKWTRPRAERLDQSSGPPVEGYRSCQNTGLELHGQTVDPEGPQSTEDSAVPEGSDGTEGPDGSFGIGGREVHEVVGGTEGAVDLLGAEALEVPGGTEDKDYLQSLRECPDSLVGAAGLDGPEVPEGSKGPEDEELEDPEDPEWTGSLEEDLDRHFHMIRSFVVCIS